MLCAGTVAAAILNVHRAEGSKPVSPFDFVPGGKPEGKPVKREVQTLDEQIAVLTEIMRCGPSIPNGRGRPN